MSLPLEYDFYTIEKKWYACWLEQGLFTTNDSTDRQPYTLVMPPPNVTGILHLGHVLNNVIQDTLVRKARMEGRSVCWVPGLDHAAIATEAKVVEMLQGQGIRKDSLSREAFLSHAWAWKERYGGIIFEQLKELGVSCDWGHACFTLDEGVRESVKGAFIKLYDEGYIYRDERMIHWDPKGQTALADEEVVYREVEGCLYYIRYDLEDGGEVVVATTRPETLLGDTAICVHPEDKRYEHLRGRCAYVPLVGRRIPIIVDDYVDRALGTGCLKVTPAHDVNDYAIGKRHGLASIDILCADGTLHARAGLYVGEDRAVARKKIVEELERQGHLVKVVRHRHQVGFSERTMAIIEPRVSTQWFVRMKDLAVPALEAVEKGEIRFYPSRFQNLYGSWMKGIRDWCISRQLWWGHRIPAYYLSDGRFVVANDIQEAVRRARILTGDECLGAGDLRQDEDVLDTWFSAWLWPMVVFDGMRSPDTERFAYRYPTDDLVTAPDIIFFWVARMIMAGYAFTGRPPFRHVYFTGLVRDKRGRKMSKSLGNSPNPLDLIKKYGADSVRAGMLFCSPAGNDLLFDEKLCVQGSRFVHKIWNALRLVRGWRARGEEVSLGLAQAVRWFTHRYRQVVGQVNEHFRQFRISEALILIYRLVWDDFCSHYLEMVKPIGEKEVPVKVYEATVGFFSDLMRLLHPFMPFITEEVWHRLHPDREQESIGLGQWPRSRAFDEVLLAQATDAFVLINRIRHLKTQHVWDKQEGLTLVAQGELPSWAIVFRAYIQKATGVRHMLSGGKREDEVGCVIGGHTFFLPELRQKDRSIQRVSLSREQERVRRVLEKASAKLSNEQFVRHAPEEVVNYVRRQKTEAEERLQALEALVNKALKG